MAKGRQEDDSMIMAATKRRRKALEREKSCIEHLKETVTQKVIKIAQTKDQIRLLAASENFYRPKMANMWDNC